MTDADRSYWKSTSTPSFGWSLNGNTFGQARYHAVNQVSVWADGDEPYAAEAEWVCGNINSSAFDLGNDPPEGRAFCPQCENRLRAGPPPQTPRAALDACEYREVLGPCQPSWSWRGRRPEGSDE